MNNKKGLSDIVTNVLIILLVLVSVSIIWMFLRPTIESGIGQTGGTTDCLTVDLEPVSCNGTDIIIKRNPGSGTLKDIKVIVNGSLNGGIGSNPWSITPAELDELETTSFDAGLLPGNWGEVEVAAVVDDGSGGDKICQKSARTITC